MAKYYISDTNTSQEDHSSVDLQPPTPTATSQAPADIVTVNTQFYKTRPRWTNKLIREKLTITDLELDSTIYNGREAFQRYIRDLCPKDNARSEFAQEVCNAIGSTKGYEIPKLQAFVLKVFPPIHVRTDQCLGLMTGDIIPQFKVTKPEGTVVFECVCCAYWEVMSGQKCKSKDKKSIGISQTYVHGTSTFHKNAVSFLFGHDDLGRTPMERYIRVQHPAPAKCFHVYEPWIVSQYQDKPDQIHQQQYKTTLKQHPELQCTRHEECSDYQVWKKVHKVDFEKIKELTPPTKAIYVPSITGTLTVKGQKVHVNGSIKSIFPLCTDTVGKNNKHFRSSNCQKLYNYLSNNLKKPRKLPVGDRISRQGMRNDYLTTPERAEKLKKDKIVVIQVQKENRDLKRQLQSTEDWENVLSKHCDTQNEAKLISDLHDLFRQDVVEKNPVQLVVLQNLVGKLKSGRNHHFNRTSKRIAKMHKNWLGETHYSVLKVSVFE